MAPTKKNILTPHNPNIASKYSSPTSTSEDLRRSMFYDSLVRAQQHYAQKICEPGGSDGRFTTDEWNGMGDSLDIKDWDAAFIPNGGQNTYYHRTLKKENMGR